MEVPRERLQVSFSRSSGPGGQNVNKVATRVEVRFQLESADWIPPLIRSRLASLHPRRLNRLVLAACEATFGKGDAERREQLLGRIFGNDALPVA